MNVVQETKTMCNHFFCELGGKQKYATHRVEQTFPNGYVKVTNCCPNDFEAFSVVINRPEDGWSYVVTEL
jgi:hypothetical protein